MSNLMTKIQIDNGPAKFMIVELEDGEWPEAIDIAVRVGDDYRYQYQDEVDSLRNDVDPSRISFMKYTYNRYSFKGNKTEYYYSFYLQN